MVQSDVARWLLDTSGGPLLMADWLKVVFIHFEVEADVLQRVVPFELDVREGRAYVSLVAFTMRNLRPRVGGRVAALLFKPIATHHFLNVRTYVRHEGEAGIHFLAEWLDNPLSVMLGPATFGLPYRYGRLDYAYDCANGMISGCVNGFSGNGARLKYHAEFTGEPDASLLQMCEPDWAHLSF